MVSNKSCDSGSDIPMYPHGNSRYVSCLAVTLCHGQHDMSVASDMAESLFLSGTNPGVRHIEKEEPPSR